MGGGVQVPPLLALVRRNVKLPPCCAPFRSFLAMAAPQRTRPACSIASVAADCFELLSSGCTLRSARAVGGPSGERRGNHRAGNSGLPLQAQGTGCHMPNPARMLSPPLPLMVPPEGGARGSSRGLRVCSSARRLMSGMGQLQGARPARSPPLLLVPGSRNSVSFWQGPNYSASASSSFSCTGSCFSANRARPLPRVRLELQKRSPLRGLLRGSAAEPRLSVRFVKGFFIPPFQSSAMEFVSPEGLRLERGPKILTTGNLLNSSLLGMGKDRRCFGRRMNVSAACMVSVS